MTSHPLPRSSRATQDSMSSYTTARQSTSSHSATNAHLDNDQESLQSFSTIPIRDLSHAGTTFAGTGPPLHVGQLPELTRSSSTVDLYSSSTTPPPHTPVSAVGVCSPSSVRTGSLSSIRAAPMDDHRPSQLSHLAPSPEVGQLHAINLDGGHIHGNMLPKQCEPKSPRDLHLTHDDSSDWEDIDSDTKEEDAGSSAESGARPPAWTYELPSEQDVRDAADCNIIDEWGDSIRFGDMLPGGPAWSCTSHGAPPVSRLVVLFVGHWWCGLCHDYALVSVTKLSPAVLFREGVRVVLVSSGSWQPIKKYRSMFKIPFPVFVDPGTRLFKSLGLRTGLPNPIAEARLKHRPSYHRHVFVRQMVTGMTKGIFRLGGIRFNHPGSFTQLGGEFVFSSRYRCDFAHRMTNRADHCEAPDVLGAVGIDGRLGDPVCSLPTSVLQGERPRRGFKPPPMDEGVGEKCPSKGAEISSSRRGNTPR